jgi:predicted dehydrogenase
MNRQHCASRRSFLKGITAAGAAVLGPRVLPSSVFGADAQVAPSNRITLGCIGIGGEGTRNLQVFLQQPDARVVAVCEVDPARRQHACDSVNRRYQSRDCASHTDFREIIARPDIDGVVISTPDQWHVPMSLMAVRAGKDVICEKPTRTIAEGRLLADAVAHYGRVFQTSTEDRGLAVYHRMAELVRNGRVGKLQRIHVGLPSGPGGPGDPTPQPVPPGFDYDMWLGPAPWAPYCPGRVHFNFRWISDYSSGMLADWGAHLFDTAQWGNDTERTGPVAVEGTGKRHEKGLYDTFYEFHLRYTYASGVEMIVDSGAVGLRFEGTDGWVGNKGWIGPLAASNPEILKSEIGPNEIRLYTCAAGEHRNFLDCVKSRREPYFPAEIGHRVSSLAHIGNIAMLLGRQLRWNPAAEKFENDDVADRMRSQAMRAPWTV